MNVGVVHEARGFGPGVASGPASFGAPLGGGLVDGGSDEEVAALLESGNWLGEVSPVVWEGDRPLIELAALPRRPGPAMAHLLAEAPAGGLDDDGLLTVAAAWRQMAGWAKAGELAAVAEFLARREGQYGGDSQAMDAAMAELQCALGFLTNFAMDRLASLAQALSDPLTGTWQALRDGLIDEAKAHVIVIGTGALDAAHARLVENRVLPAAPGQSTGQLRAAVARAVLAVDPEGAERRRRDSETRRRVELRPDGEHTAGLAGRDLPVTEALAADQRLTTLARALKAAGDTRPLQYLRATVFLDLLLDGPHHDTATPNPTATPATAGADRTVAPDATATPATAGADRTVAPDATATPATAGADSTGAGSTAGAGATAAPADFRTPGSHRPRFVPVTEVHLTLRQRDLQAVPGGGHQGVRKNPDTVGTRTRRPRPRPRPGAGAAAAAPPAAPTAPGVTPVRLVVPLDTLRGRGERAGEILGFGPVSAHVARSLARTVATSHRRRPWCYSVLDDQGNLIDHGHIPPRLDGSDTLDPDRLLTEIAGRHHMTGAPDCAHEHGRDQGPYQVRGALRHQIQTRDRTCRFPTCRRPATRCDTDHTTPWDAGGPSCPCNLAALCRRHHRTKQADGWHLTQPQPGHLEWTTPTGRRYTVNPDSYHPGDWPDTHPDDPPF